MRLSLRQSAYAARAAAAAFALIISSSAAAYAQSSRSAGDAAKTDLLLRQRALWELDKLKGAPRARKAAARAAYPEIAEEFRQLQLRNYELAGAARPDAEPDYALIRRESAEVRRRAERLKSALLLPGVEPDEIEAADVRTAEEMGAAIGKLDALVNSFAWNPTFHQPGVVDAEQSVRASRDLEGILKLSARIRKCAESLSKGAAKKP